MEMQYTLIYINRDKHQFAPYITLHKPYGTIHPHQQHVYISSATNKSHCEHICSSLTGAGGCLEQCTKLVGV